MKSRAKQQEFMRHSLFALRDLFALRALSAPRDLFALCDRAALGRFWPVVMISSALACGTGPEDWPEGHPRIDTLTYLQQSPQDPLAFQFLIEFTDTDGDVGRGVLLLAVDGGSAVSLELADVFPSQSPALPLDAAQGEFEVVARIGRAVEIGDQVEMAFRLRDAKGRESNEPSVVLEAISSGD